MTEIVFAKKEKIERKIGLPKICKRAKNNEHAKQSCDEKGGKKKRSERRKKITVQLN